MTEATNRELELLEKENKQTCFLRSEALDLLERALGGMPLTPITDDDFPDPKEPAEAKEDYLKENDLKYSLPCKRLRSLCKEETSDGKVYYTDDDRTVCRDEERPDAEFSCEYGSKIVDRMFPIKMPYWPPMEKYEVAFKGGKPIWVKTPTGEKIKVSESALEESSREIKKYVDQAEKELREKFNELIFDYGDNDGQYELHNLTSGFNTLLRYARKWQKAKEAEEHGK